MNYYDKSNSQLVAHCFFAHGKVEYNNYDKYYVQEDTNNLIFANHEIEFQGIII